jgi:hypothetical protein
MTPFRFGQKIASQPSMFGDYLHQLNKFYNPWSKAWNEPATDGIEKGLQYAGRAAMGIGAGAAAAAGGLAAAPAVASAGNTAMATAGSLGTAAMTQGQRLADTATNTLNRVAPRATAVASKTMDTLNKFNYSPMDVAQDAYSVGTGNFDKIKGPGIIKGPSFPMGAPSMPRPMQMAQNASQFMGDVQKYLTGEQAKPWAGVGANMLAHSPR